MRFRAPAVFDDRLLVHARCLDLRGARFRFEYAIERDGTRDRRRLDGARDGRRATLRPDADARVAARGYRRAAARPSPAAGPTPPEAS